MHTHVVYTIDPWSIVMSKKRSPIWEFFKVNVDSKFATCNTCEKDVSHGEKQRKALILQCKAVLKCSSHIRQKGFSLDSGAGNLYKNTRSRLTPEHAEKYCLSKTIFFFD